MRARTLLLIGVHWVECLGLHLNLYSWGQIEDVFRDLIIIQKWSFNKAISIKTQRCADLIVHWLKHLWLLRFARVFRRISRLKLTNSSRVRWANSWFFWTWCLLNPALSIITSIALYRCRVSTVSPLIMTFFATFISSLTLFIRIHLGWWGRR